MLDADPADWQTRLIFADWLEERDDARAEGYRALGANLLFPGTSDSFPCWWGRRDNLSGMEPEERHGGLLIDWFFALPAAYRSFWWADYSSRREAEDAAAIAFAKLPPERRAELLAAGAVA